MRCAIPALLLTVLTTGWGGEAATVEEALWLRLEAFSGPDTLSVVLRRSTVGWHAAVADLGTKPSDGPSVMVGSWQVTGTRVEGLVLVRERRAAAGAHGSFGSWQEEDLRESWQETGWRIAAELDPRGRLQGTYTHAADPGTQAGRLDGERWQAGDPPLARWRLRARGALGPQHDLGLTARYHGDEIHLLSLTAAEWNTARHALLGQVGTTVADGWNSSAELVLHGDGYVPAGIRRTAVRLHLSLPPEGPGRYRLEPLEPGIEAAHGDVAIERQLLGDDGRRWAGAERAAVARCAAAEAQGVPVCLLAEEPGWPCGDPALDDATLPMPDPATIHPVIGNQFPADPFFTPAQAGPRLPPGPGGCQLTPSHTTWGQPPGWQAFGPFPRGADQAGRPRPLAALVPAADDSRLVAVTPDEAGLVLPPSSWHPTLSGLRHGARWYAACTITVPQDLPHAWISLRTTLDIGKFGGNSRGHAALWLNGRQIWASDRHDEDRCDRAAILPLSLAAGTYRLLLEVQSDTRAAQGFACHLLGAGAPATADAVAAREAARRARLAAAPAWRVQGFRGDFTGAFPTATPPAAWDLSTGTNIRWQVPLPSFSNATPLLFGSGVITLSEPGTVLCLASDDGRELWRRTLSLADVNADLDHLTTRRLVLEQERAQARKRRQEATKAEEREAADASLAASNEEWSALSTSLSQHGVPKMQWGSFMGATFASPTSDGERLVVKHASGLVAAFDTEGRELWQQRFPIKPNVYETSSPILIDGLVVLRWNGRPAGGHHSEGSLYVALDAITGTERWRTQLSNRAAGGTALPLRLADGEQVLSVLATPCGAVLRVTDGALLANTGLSASAGWTIPSAQDNLLIYPQYWNNYASVRVLLDGPDRVIVQPVHRPLWWGGGTHHFFTGDIGVLYQGRFHTNTVVKEHDLTHPCGWHLLNVVDTATGALVRRLKPALRDAAYGYTPPVIGGSLLFLTDSGAPSGGCFPRRPGGPDSESLIGVFDLAHDCLPVAMNPMPRMQAPPLCAGDRLYIRTHRSLVCVAPTDAAYQRRMAVAQLFDEVNRHVEPAQTPVVDLPAPQGRQLPPTAPCTSLHGIGLPPALLAAGPFPADQARSLLTDLAAEAVPLSGQECLGQAWAPLPPALLGESTDLRSLTIDYLACFGRQPGTCGLIATVLHVTRRQVLRVTISSGLSAVLAGQALTSGQMLRLHPGHYPLLLRQDIGRLPPLMVQVRARFSLEPSQDPTVALATWRRQVAPLLPALATVVAEEAGTSAAFRARVLLEHAVDQAGSGER